MSFMDLQKIHSQTLDAYDAIAPMYEEYSSKRTLYLNKIDDLVISCLSPDMKLLDIGAGDGRRLLKITSASGIRDFIAVEPSPGMASLCKLAVRSPVYELLAEDIDQISESEFDVVTALWNVFGHIPSSQNRIIALQHIKNKLKPGGILIVDVNNRHNAVAYGRVNVLKRRVIDFFGFKESRGDAAYEWKIGDQVFQGSGHLFTPSEIEGLFLQAGLNIRSRLSVDYATGAQSLSPYEGQLFYIAERAIS